MANIFESLKKNESEKKVEFFRCAKCGAATKIEKNSINHHDHWGRKWFSEDVLCEKCTARKPFEKELSKWKEAKIREEQGKSERCGTSNDGMRSEWSEGAKYWAVVTPDPNAGRYDYRVIELFASHEREKCEKFLADGLYAAEKALEKAVGREKPEGVKRVEKENAMPAANVAPEATVKKLHATEPGSYPLADFPGVPDTSSRRGSVPLLIAGTWKTVERFRSEDGADMIRVSAGFAHTTLYPMPDMGSTESVFVSELPPEDVVECGNWETPSWTREKEDGMGLEIEEGQRERKTWVMREIWERWKVWVWNAPENWEKKGAGYWEEREFRASRKLLEGSEKIEYEKS